MHSSAWVALLRHIPSELQNQFSLVTNSGTEISIQSLLRIEVEFVVVKGRLSGSQDAGRVFFIPYCHIDYFGYTHPVKDTDFNDNFGGLKLPEVIEVAVVPPPPADLPQPVSVPAKPDSGVRPAIRSEVLDRFRSRPSSAVNLPNPTRQG